MLHITSLQVISGHSLLLQFNDGTHAEVGLTAELTGPVFEALLDLDQFQQAILDPRLRTVCWPNRADFAPEFLRSLVTETQLA
jgi:hypothetical protein